MKFEMCCMECGSEDVTKYVQIFKNETRHLYVKCHECRKQFYAPSKFITPDLEVRESRHRKKEREQQSVGFENDFSI